MVPSAERRGAVAGRRCGRYRFFGSAMRGPRGRGVHDSCTGCGSGFGATAACLNLVSRFSMEDVNKVRKGKGEFLIATFNGGTLLKIYTVKDKHIKKLGL